MTKEFMKTAKELARKAHKDAYELAIYKTMNESELAERFENWWSDNYGNRDSTKFTPKHNIYVESKRYIQAE